MLSEEMMALLDQRREKMTEAYFKHRLSGERPTRVFVRLAAEFRLSESTVRNELRRLGLVRRSLNGDDKTKNNKKKQNH